MNDLGKRSTMREARSATEDLRALNLDNNLRASRTPRIEYKENTLTRMNG